MLKRDGYLLYIKGTIGFAPVRSASRHLCRGGGSAVGAARMRRPFSFRGKKTGVARPKERRLHCKRAAQRAAMLANCTFCARRCRVSTATRFASASIIRCRSASLVVVQPNFRLPPVSTMRRAQQCRIPQAVCRRANVTRASR